MLQVIFDGRFEIGDAMKDAASDGILCDQAEEALDQIDPGRRSRREVEMEAPVAFEPCLDLGMLVGCVVSPPRHADQGTACCGPPPSLPPLPDPRDAAGPAIHSSFPQIR